MCCSLSNYDFACVMWCVSVITVVLERKFFELFLAGMDESRTSLPPGVCVCVLLLLCVHHEMGSTIVCPI